MSNLNILHANPHTLARTGLKSLLFKGGGINKVDDVESKEELIQQLKNESYDLVVIDYDSQCSFCFNDIKQVQKEFPITKLLVVSSEQYDPNIHKILESGINGCITRACSEDEILNAIFAIAKGEKFFCNKIIDVILQKHLYQKEEDLDCAPTTLTEREAEVTGLIASGMTNKEIAEKLFLSPHTIHTHRKKIMKKLKIKSVSELTIYAVNTGLYKPN